MISYISPLQAATDLPWPRKLVLLGSTGSIGTSALNFIRHQAHEFRVLALAGANNITLLAQQATLFRPAYLAVLHEASIDKLSQLLPAGYTPQIFAGQEGYARLAALEQADIVLSAQVGAAGLQGTFAAVEAGKTIALANKEALVLAGPLIRKTAQATGACILPVDSEHNALFQCIQGHEPSFVQQLILTASGGPFRDLPAEALAHVTPEQALCHPNWDMGAKISIDSATLMNKGLELIEAHYLFGIAPEHIDVVIHKESIIHSLAEFTDGSLLAQLGTPDMRTAIAYAFSYPRRLDTGVQRLRLADVQTLSLCPPNTSAFPCLSLARQALSAGWAAPIALNAANEVAVEAFLHKKITFTAIADLVRTVLEEWLVPSTQTKRPQTSLQDILTVDAAARALANTVLSTQYNADIYETEN